MTVADVFVACHSWQSCRGVAQQWQVARQCASSEHVDMAVQVLHALRKPRLQPMLPASALRVSVETLARKRTRLRNYYVQARKRTIGQS